MPLFGAKGGRALGDSPYVNLFTLKGLLDAKISTTRFYTEVSTMISAPARPDRSK